MLLSFIFVIPLVRRGRDGGSRVWSNMWGQVVRSKKPGCRHRVRGRDYRAYYRAFTSSANFALLLTKMPVLIKFGVKRLIIRLKICILGKRCLLHCSQKIYKKEDSLEPQVWTQSLSSSPVIEPLVCKVWHYEILNVQNNVFLGQLDHATFGFISLEHQITKMRSNFSAWLLFVQHWTPGVWGVMVKPPAAWEVLKEPIISTNIRGSSLRRPVGRRASSQPSSGEN